MHALWYACSEFVERLGASSGENQSREAQIFLVIPATLGTSVFKPQNTQGTG